MKQDLQTLKSESKGRILEAFFRLDRNSKDFSEVKDFIRYCLETRKKELITVSVDDFQRVQGEASVLSGFLDLLELAEKEADNSRR